MKVDTTHPTQHLTGGGTNNLPNLRALPLHPLQIAKFL